MERAKYLDEYLATQQKPMGPLHGLPISVKEHIGMKGLGLNGGFVGWWEHVAAEDAFILQLLQRAGCVLYVRTTQPQCLMHLETSNNLYGVTVNPYNKTLTCGGSSGGEGALLGLRGSPLGIGTDIGGSIRSPAANNGVWGFRPSSYRLPLGGLTAPMAGQEQIVPVIGPLSTSFEGCHLFMKAIIDQKPWLVDPSLMPMPWRYPPGDSPLLSAGDEGQGIKKLRIGVLWSDGVVQPHPPVTRALREITTKLRATPGIELVDWTPYRHDRAWEIISALYFCDGARQDREALAASGEPWRPLSEFIIKEQAGVPAREYTVSQVWQLTLAREEYRAAYAARWNEHGAVDVILCPAGPGAAPPLDQSRYWGYTSQWNLLDYPALIFPVTQVDAAKDPVDATYKPLNHQDAFNYNLYAPDRYTDAPVSLQLVGRRYHDEKVFEAMAWIKDAVGDLPLAPFR